MDRFIGTDELVSLWQSALFKIQYGQIYRTSINNQNDIILQFKIQYGQIYSMPCPLQAIAYICLKSNMDRFIAVTGVEEIIMFVMFKIQYGQIYRQIRVILPVRFEV